MKRIAFIGGNPNAQSFNSSTEAEFSRAGNNTGNYAFWNAVDRQILGSKEYFEGWGFSPEYLRDFFDVVVLPSSNFIHPDRDMGVLANKLEKTGLPVISIGLGAQAPKENENVVFKPGTIRFAKVLSELSEKIVVRGEHTASVLDSFGVRNVEVLGCPSNFTNLNPKLGVENEVKMQNLLDFDDSEFSVLVNIDAHRRKFSSSYRKFFEMFKKGSFEIVCQNPIELVSMARGDVWPGDNSHILHQASLWCPGEDLSVLRKFVKKHFVTFFNAAAWMEYARKFDISVGTRLHGNMLAFQAGVPSSFVSHDSRTSELVSVMKLPTCSWESLEMESIRDVVSMTNFDGGLYDVNRKFLAKKYVDVLNSYGVTVCGDLLDFAGNG
ncbi:polysaccharide pyruvyl transferase family protein [Microbulbifer elongatus]|uniref:Polysaccharide pyruvyl transferase family protein n=1 Tax=Microbulbifer elongatus TaxID=86173 RepID=A0ABT1NWY2_9GAMM|nr:polysaccharide pyruvyl transferase family protein [Microbulbifer elongatus]MCQ3828322.1 polysaccharide pyruvyl transferase family protein [Microbulbifer elongatus]